MCSYQWLEVAWKDSAYSGVDCPVKEPAKAFFGSIPLESREDVLAKLFQMSSPEKIQSDSLH